MHLPRFVPALLAVMCVGIAAQQHATYEDDVPLDEYLAALNQVSPAAREGAEAFLLAHRERCGSGLTTVELRRAIADGSGDPVLMGMIRAAADRDTTAMQRLASTVACRRH